MNALAYVQKLEGTLKNASRLVKAGLHDLPEKIEKLVDDAKKLEKDLKAPALSRPSRVYAAASKGTGAQILYLLHKSDSRLVQDRLKNHLQKYLMVDHELTEEEVLETGVKPGTPKYAKARLAVLFKKLDARPKKIVVEEVPPTPLLAPPIVASARR